MLSFVVGRLLRIPLLVFIVTSVTFIAVSLSGDEIALYVPMDAPQEVRLALREKLHFNDPLPVQYGYFISGAIRGDFGESLRYQRNAMSVVGDYIGATVQLAAVGLGLGLAAGLILGYLAALKRGSWADTAVMALGTLGQAVPTFWLGIMLIMFFAVQLKWLPTSGIGGINHTILPALTLAFFLLPQVSLMTRSSLIETMEADYVTVARGKGLRPSAVLFRHITPNALNPVVSLLGLEIGRLLGGAVITEAVFAWPGLGWLSLQAVLNRDMPIVQATVVLLSVSVALSNLAADVINALMDPRIRESGQ